MAGAAVAVRGTRGRAAGATGVRRWWRRRGRGAAWRGGGRDAACSGQPARGSGDGAVVRAPACACARPRVVRARGPLASQSARSRSFETCVSRGFRNPGITEVAQAARALAGLQLRGSWRPSELRRSGGAAVCWRGSAVVGVLWTLGVAEVGWRGGARAGSAVAGALSTPGTPEVARRDCMPAGAANAGVPSTRGTTEVGRRPRALAGPQRGGATDPRNRSGPGRGRPPPSARGGPCDRSARPTAAPPGPGARIPPPRGPRIPTG